MIQTEFGVDAYKFVFDAPFDESLDYFIKWQNTDGEGRVAELVKESGNSLVWTPELAATSVSGPMFIQIFGSRVEGTDSPVQTGKWLTERGRVRVHISLDPDKQADVSASLFDRWLTEAQGVRNAISLDVASAKASEVNAKASETNAAAIYDKAYALTGARCEIDDTSGHLMVTVPDKAGLTFRISNNQNLEVEIA